MKVHILGIDLAKNVFQLHGVDRKGRPVLVRRVRREQLLRTIGELEPCLIGIEASTGAFYWQRQFEKLGHAVKIMAPQYVKPFVRRQKNDSNDAEAICTAVQQRNMRFVPKKTLEQQDIQALHRARQRLVNHRTALISQMRGLLLDRGIAIAVSATRARRLIPKILAAPTFERRPTGADGYQQTWQSALKDASRTWRPSSRPHGSQKNRLEKHVG